MQKNFIKIFGIIILILQNVGFSQTFSASTNSSTVGQSDQFQVSFTFSGSSVNGLSNFRPPSFSNFMVLSGPNQSTSMQIINGASSASITYSYYVQPKNIGKFKIGSASVDFNGKTYNTEPLAITVVKGAPQPKKSQQNSSGVSNEEIGKNLFIRAVADRSKAYIGQQVTVTYKLYTRVNIASQMSVSKLPSYQGFWAEEIDVPNNISFTTETYEGKQYRVGVLKKVALFPSQSGELSVTPFELNVPIQVQQKRQRSNNVFDDFFNDPFFGNYKTINFDAKSNTLKIKAIPLPSENVPKSFNGAVGNYSFNVDASSNKTSTNNPIDLKIDISGTGNIKLLNSPDISLPPGFEKYEPKTSDKINRTGQISGSKTIDYLIVPRVAGKKEIPAIQFSYFDPAKKSYVSLSSKPIVINVAQGKVEAEGGSTGGGLSKEDVKLLGNDIRYIKTSDFDLSKSNGIIVQTSGFWIAVIAPFLLLVGFITWKVRTDKLAQNVQLLRYQRAQKVAKARFKNAHKLMESGDQKAFFSEISLALFGYLEDKLHIPKAESSLERASAELQKRSIDENLISELKECAEECEYARFAPSGNGESAMNDMYDKLTKVIIELEKSLAVKK